MRDNDSFWFIHTITMISSSTSGSNSKEFSVKNHDRLSHPLSFGKEHLCLSQDVKTFSENTYSSLCSTDQHKGGTCDRYPTRSGTGLERISAIIQSEKQVLKNVGNKKRALLLWPLPLPTLSFHQHQRKQKTAQRQQRWSNSVRHTRGGVMTATRTPTCVSTTHTKTACSSPRHRRDSLAGDQVKWTTTTAAAAETLKGHWRTLFFLYFFFYKFDLMVNGITVKTTFRTVSVTRTQVDDCLSFNVNMWVFFFFIRLCSCV